MRGLAETKKLLVERLQGEGRRVAHAEATARAAACATAHAAAQARLNAIPAAASALEERLRLTLGRGGAELKSGAIRRAIDHRRKVAARVALVRLAAGGDAGLLEEDCAQGEARVRALGEDVRAVRALLETAGAEHHKAPWEMELNPSVLQMCADQARKLKEGAGVGLEEELVRLCEVQMEGMARLCGRVGGVTAAGGAEGGLQLAEVRAAFAEGEERRGRAEEELAGVAAQRARVEEEFLSLKATVERFRDSEAVQERELGEEVRRLEEAAAHKRGDAEAAWKAEMEAVRRAASAEAEVRWVCV